MRESSKVCKGDMQSLLDKLGYYFKSSLISVNDDSENQESNHLEYHPMLNSSIHKMGDN